MSPALAGWFLTTGPLGKSLGLFTYNIKVAFLGHLYKETLFFLNVILWELIIHIVNILLMIFSFIKLLLAYNIEKYA